MNQHPHRRYNPLKDEWVLVSPHRTKRPWNGAMEQAQKNVPPHDSTCNLCPNNERINGDKNPNYKEQCIFTNDYQAIYPRDTSKEKRSDDELFQDMPVSGTCKVICFSPRHDITLAQMDVNDIARTFSTIQQEVIELEKTYAWVQVFENKGELMGCSNPHPHCQVWASDAIPNEVVQENTTQKKYAEQLYSIMLADYRGDELLKKERIIKENEDWVVVVPYWAVWPYETMVLPKKDIHRFNELTPDDIESFAQIVQKLLKGYDALFQTSFPYSMGLHGAPVGEKADHWLFHAHYYPPLLRSATIKKHLVGYEMLAEAQRDITAEQAAETLRG